MNAEVTKAPSENLMIFSGLFNFVAKLYRSFLKILSRRGLLFPEPSARDALIFKNLQLISRSIFEIFSLEPSIFGNPPLVCHFFPESSARDPIIFRNPRLVAGLFLNLQA
jgi:hypothetical protein